MTLPTPKLDDRSFQDIVDQAKTLISRYTPEWTDHNVSDPGVTLIELFAWMMELMLFRLNKVPDKNYIKFMELVGMRLNAPTPAKAAVTFWLSAPQPTNDTIPAGTEVATVRTGTEETIIFTTNHPLTVVVPYLLSCQTSPDGSTFHDHTSKLDLEGQAFFCFASPPRPNNALYLGYQDDISNNILGLSINCKIEGIGVDPKNPPLAWEAYCGEKGWAECQVDRDSTGGLNRTGEVALHIPPGLAPQRLKGLDKDAYWVRCRLTPTEPNQPSYSQSPRIHSIQSNSLGGATAASHAQSLSGEMLGRSDGTPSQVFQLEQYPVLPCRPGEHLLVETVDGDWENWGQVADFGDSGPDDKHYTLDSVSGQIRFGPVIRQSKGTEQPFGATPPKNARLRFEGYRVGGGSVGNVGANALTVLKSSIPYVARVANREPARGGLDQESIEAAKLRAPQMIRTRHRAVTAEDFEYLAREASPRVARARCLQPRAAGDDSAPPPGLVRVIIIPAIGAAGGRVAPELLQPNEKLVKTVTDYLDERRLLTTALQVDGAKVISVTVDASVVIAAKAAPDSAAKAIEDRLYEFLNPLAGGPNDDGWPFGRPLHVSEIFAAIQRVPGVEFVESVIVSQVDPSTGKAQRVDPKLEIPPDAVITSYSHRVQVKRFEF